MSILGMGLKQDREESIDQFSSDLQKELAAMIPTESEAPRGVSDKAPLPKADRLVMQIGEGAKDFVRDTVVGTTLMLKMGEERKNWEMVERREAVEPFSTFSPVAKSQFADYMREKEVNPNQLSPEEFANLRLTFKRQRSEEYKNYLSSTEKSVREIFKSNPELLNNQTFLEKIFRTAPQVAGQVVASVVSGGWLSLPTMGSMIVGSSYDQNIKDGVPHDRALNMAMLNGILQAPLEQIGIGKVTKFFKPKKAIFKKLQDIAKAGFSEGITEMMQQYPDVWTNLMAKEPDENKLKQLLDVIHSPEVFVDALESGAIGAILGGGAVATQQGARSAYEKLRKQAPAIEGDVGGTETDIQPEQQLADLTDEQLGEVSAEQAARELAALEQQGRDIDRPEAYDAADQRLAKEKIVGEPTVAPRKVSVTATEYQRLRDAGLTTEQINSMTAEQLDSALAAIPALEEAPVKGKETIETVIENRMPVAELAQAEAERITPNQFERMKQMIDAKNFEDAAQRLRDNGHSEEFIETLKPEGYAETKEPTQVERLREMGISEKGIQQIADTEGFEYQKPKVQPKDVSKGTGGVYKVVSPEVKAPPVAEKEVAPIPKPVEKPMAKVEKPVPTPVKKEIVQPEPSEAVEEEEPKLLNTPSYSEKQVKMAIEEVGVEPESIPEVKEVTLNPDDFLNLATGTDQKKMKIMRDSPSKVDPKEMRKSGAVLLTVKQDGTVTGHDGRHRAATHLKDNVKPLKVVLIPDTPDVKLNEIKQLKSQSFGKFNRNKTINLSGKPVAQPEAPKRVVKTETGKVVEPKVTEPTRKPVRKKIVTAPAKRVPALPKTYKKEVDPREMDNRQLENEIEKLQYHLDEEGVPERLTYVREVLEDNKAKQSAEGVTQKVMSQDERMEKVAAAIEEGTLTQEDAGKVHDVIFTTKDGKPVIKKNILAIGQKFANKTKLGYSAEELINEAYVRGLYQMATGSKNISPSSIGGFIQNFLQEDTPVVAPKTVIRKGGAKVTRTTSEEQLDVLAKQAEEAETGRRVGRKATDEYTIEDVQAGGSDVTLAEAESTLGKGVAEVEAEADESTAITERDKREAAEIEALNDELKYTPYNLKPTEPGFVDLYKDGALVAEDMDIDSVIERLDVLKEETAKAEEAAPKLEKPSEQEQKFDHIPEGPALAQDAEADAGVKIEYNRSADDQHMFRIVSEGPHYGANFMVTSAEPTTTDVVTAAMKHMDQREADAAKAGKVPEPKKSLGEWEKEISTDRFDQDYVDKVRPVAVKLIDQWGLQKEFEKVLDAKLTKEQTADLMVEMMQLGRESGGMTLIGDSLPTQPKWLIDKAYENITGSKTAEPQKSKEEMIGMINKFFKDDAVKGEVQLNASDIAEGTKKRLKTMRKVAVKVASKFQIGVDIGNRAMARKVIAHNSNVEAHTERELRAAKEVQALEREHLAGMSAKEKTEVVVAFENEDVFKELSPEKQAKYKPVIDWMKKYFGDMKDRMADMGKQVDYVRRALDDAKARMEAARTDEEIEAAANDIALFKQMNYAPVPVELLRRQLNAVIRNGSKKERKTAKATIRFMDDVARNRKVKSLKGLLDKVNEKKTRVTITPTQLVGAYAARAARDLAVNDVIQEMVNAGWAMPLVKGKTPPSGFKAVSHAKHPALSKYWLNQRGIEILDGLKQEEVVTGVYDKWNARTKLLQFFNPLIMGWNNAIQGVGSGTWFTPKLGKHFKEAVNHINERSDLYLALKASGLMSRPIEYSRRSALEMIDRIEMEGMLGKLATRNRIALLKAKPNTASKLSSQLDTFTMGALHDSAWYMDNVMRMTTALGALNRGMSIKEAAELGALIHGDYASVPAGSRKKLNRFLFTPTFKIVMTVAGVKMYKDSAAAVAKYATGKGKDVTNMQKAMLTMLGSRILLEATIHGIAKGMGYELEDDDWWNFGTRYVHKDTGESLVIPSPFNIGRRLLGKTIKQYKRQDGITPYGIWKVFQGDVAVLPKIAYEMLTNQSWDGSPIHDEFDSKYLKGMKLAHHGLTRTFALAGHIAEQSGMQPESLESDYALRLKERDAKLGMVTKALLSFVPVYRGPAKDDPRIGLTRKYRNLANNYKSELKKAGEQGKLKGGRQAAWTAEYLRRMQDILDEIEKIDKKEQPSATKGTQRKYGRKR